MNTNVHPTIAHILNGVFGRPNEAGGARLASDIDVIDAAKLSRDADAALRPLSSSVARTPNGRTDAPSFDLLRPDACGQPITYIGNENFNVRVPSLPATLAHRSEAVESARAAVSEAIHKCLAQHAAQMTPDERGKLLAVLFNAESGDGGWSYEKRKRCLYWDAEKAYAPGQGAHGGVAYFLDEPKVALYESTRIDFEGEAHDGGGPSKTLEW